VFILWFCWFGFNGGSTLSLTGDATLVSAGRIFVTTNLAAATAAIVTMVITWRKYKKPDVSMTLNGVLGGLVAITAGCDAVTPRGAVLIGLISGFVVVFGIELIDKVLKVDDPVGAIGVHGLCGAFGTIAVGLFAENGGLFYGGGAAMLGVQTLGVLTVALWVGVSMSVVFFVIKKTVGLRVTRDEEIAGLDIEEHGLVSSYADFMIPAPVELSELAGLAELSAAAGAAAGAAVGQAGTGALSADLSAPLAAAMTDDAAAAGAVGASGAFPAAMTANGPKMTKVTIVTRQNRLEVLKAAMEQIGITGMTVSQVLGCGMQAGQTDYYRGIPFEMKLLPKVRIEIIVCKIPPKVVIEAAKKVLYTGKYGDGKIFVYDVENVIKVRTGEEGYDALQDEDPV
jgi:Amt family ammonium transporter